MPRKFAADIDENARWNAPFVKLLSFDLCHLTLACAVETLARWGFSGPDQGDANTAERSYSAPGGVVPLGAASVSGLFHDSLGPRGAWHSPPVK